MATEKKRTAPKTETPAKATPEAAAEPPAETPAEAAPASAPAEPPAEAPAAPAAKEAAKEKEEPAPEPRPESAAEAEAARAQAEIASLKDQLLRALAEAENTRRRAAKEREEVSKYAITGFARDLLTVVDNLRRALEALPDESRKDARFSAFVEGIEMTEREFLSILERHGIRRIEPLGERFDHRYHQAMYEVEDPDKPAGTVVEVMQAGYLIADRLLRPAMVAVAKAAGKPKERVDTEA